MKKGTIVVQVAQELFEAMLVTGSKTGATIITKGLPKGAKLKSVALRLPDGVFFYFETETVKPGSKADGQTITVDVRTVDSFALMNDMVKAMLDKCGGCDVNNAAVAVDCWKEKTTDCAIANVLRKYDEYIGLDSV